MSPRRAAPEVLFGKPRNPNQSALAVYNAQVFNVSLKNDLENYLQVLRRYGPGELESLIKPPETFFSSKDSALFVWVEWMGEATFREEFLGEESPIDQDFARFEAKDDESPPEIPWSEQSIVSLADRLADIVTSANPEPSDGTPSDE